MSTLSGKVALVTGGSRGVGQGIARLFAQEGAHVIIAYRQSEQEARDTLDQIAAPGLEHLRIKVDLSMSEEVRELFSAIKAKYGRLDVLVNNAGINRDAKLPELTAEMWDEVLSTNLKGPFLCSQSAAPLMLRNGGGAIVNVSAETALNGRIGACNYVASKAGLIGLTKALAKELAPRIRVNCIALGYTLSEELSERLELHLPQNRARVISEIPLGRIGTPEEAAKVVLFLSSEASSYVTGQVFAVGGGRWM